MQQHSVTALGYSSNLLFMRRRQAANLIMSLVEDQGVNQSLPSKNLLLDALHQLPTECFIADDWSQILNQITTMLIKKEQQDGARMPTALSILLFSVQNRLQVSKTKH
jgi:hypothetical protein